MGVASLLVTLATRLVTWIVHRFDLDPVTLFADQVHQRVDVHEAVDAQDLDPSEEWPEELDPVEKVTTLEDRPDLAHVWIVNGDEDTRNHVAHVLQEAYYEHSERDPRALHLTVNDVDEIRTLSRDEVRQVVKPWLKGSERDEVTA